uniref:Uncharacterized protein n=1 Tax=Phenylobacterium glaciei TaxID=2803784 RepID=A0A974P3X3_9CAUL|nr:hypothetical protein JKL49_24875 [Phenylobacterium glaciei]
MEKSVLLWCVYMLAAELYSRDLPRAFVSYDGLLADWRAEVVRIETAHGAPLPRMSPHAEGQIDQFLTGDLRHNAGAGDLAAVPLVGPLAKTVHDWFEAAAVGPARRSRRWRPPRCRSPSSRRRWGLRLAGDLGPVGRQRRAGRGAPAAPARAPLHPGAGNRTSPAAA